METNETRVRLGQAIKRLRERECLSQERLAFMVGISRQHLNRVEGGKVNLSVGVLLKIANGLGVNGAFILDEAHLDTSGHEEPPDMHDMHEESHAHA